MITATKIFKFEAAHFLPNHPGKCKNLHGHSYTLEVEVSYGKGNSLNTNGMVIDFGDLKELIVDYIEANLDHKFLNETFPGIPTAENMVLGIVKYLKSKLTLSYPVWLVRIRLWETSTSYVEWRNDEN